MAPETPGLTDDLEEVEPLLAEDRTQDAFLDRPSSRRWRALRFAHHQAVAKVLHSWLGS